MSDTVYNPIKIAETTDTSTPPAGFQKLQAKPDGFLYVKNSAGVETRLGSGAGGETTVLKIDGGLANTTFPDYLIRLDFGNNGSTINPTGTP
jgi:hypothetical protein